ncbi:unnamed protein product [Strongylus vulgaris]|uniref:F-box/LRR-repeat protein 15-like leucin rich repeat domain-containing protein n=1 Tax=Strongylus vulgaris TaxID=40348 RepID=A0A3P7IUW3_STRVU|nr:unnamed protein product [Strongylus vulgaris]
MDDLAHPGTLPELRELNLDYVHNLSSNSKSFQHILQKRHLIKLEVRHCNGISNADLIKVPDFLVNLQVLNLSEIKYLNDVVMKSISFLKRLVELFVAFTSVSDGGIHSLVENCSTLRLLDIRGCPRITGQSLFTLSAMKSLREVWILQFMAGCADARKALEEAGSSFLVLDEVDRQKMAIPQPMDFYSIYFNNILANRTGNDA